MEESVDWGEGNRTKPALEDICAGRKRPLETDVANEGSGEGCDADLGVGVDVSNENRTKEGPEDCPVELPEEGQFRTSPDDQTTVGEQDQDCSEEEIEEDSEGIEGHNCVSGDEEDLAPEHPVLLPGVGVLEDDD